MSRKKQLARKSPRDRTSVAEYRGEDNKEQGAVPVNQDNNEEQDKTSVNNSAEEEEEEEEDPPAFDKDNQDQNKQIEINMADDSDAGSVGRPVVGPVSQALVTMTNEVNASVAGQLFVLLGFEIPASHRFVFTESINDADAFSSMTDKKLAHLIAVACKPGGRATGVAVAALAEWDLKLLVWLVKLQTMCSRPVDLGAITTHHLKFHEDLKDTIKKYDNDTINMPTLTDAMIKSNVDRLWERVNEYLTGIRGHKGVLIAWCIWYTMFPKDHLLDPEIYYASLYNEMVARCSIILTTYTGPCDTDICNAINPREFTKMFRQDNQIVYQELSHMLGHLIFWVHVKAAAKTKDGRLA